jgi:spermidine synthase
MPEPQIASGELLNEEFDESAASRFLFGASIFLSAFLLFQVQLIMGKKLLPWFGGTAAVWAACMVFYQVLLLAGYAYAHAIAKRLTLRDQAKAHLGLLALSAMLLIALTLGWKSPIIPSAEWKPQPGSVAIFGIVKLLTVSIGLPFLVLSSTGPLLQSWFSALHGVDSEKRRSPYYLYALSNAGSLLGLITYPAIFEPNFLLRVQGFMWGYGYLFFVVCCSVCTWRVMHTSDAAISMEDAAKQEEREPTRWDRALWFLLPMAGSLLMLASTNLITQDVSPIPLLWVLPLSVYLLSFIFTFQNFRWYRRGLFHPLAFAIAAVACVALFRGTEMPIVNSVAVFLATLFVFCMLCHGEVARLKPAPKYLTAFYLSLSAGGAAGGMFVALLAPYVFKGYWEYQIALWFAAFIAFMALFYDRQSWFHRPQPWIAFAVLTGIAAVPRFVAMTGAVQWPQVTGPFYTAMLVVLALLTLWLLFSGGPEILRRPEFRWNQVAVGMTLGLLATVLVWTLRGPDGTVRYRVRNFYAALTVLGHHEDDPAAEYLELVHGRISHGSQYQLPGKRHIPTSYYTLSSGAGMSLIEHPRRRQGQPLRVGAIGLGAGTEAAYAKRGDYFRFYEINPAVIELARGKNDYFTYVRDAQGQVDIVKGDARLSLEAEAAHGDFQKFDVLLVDAFSGDSIPVHLLTAEAMELYLKHMRDEDSIIAFHISNLAVNLEPVVAGLAQRYNMNATMVGTTEQSETFLASDWIVMTRGKTLDSPAFKLAGMPMFKPDTRKHDIFVPAPYWTDEFSNLVSLLKK